MDEIARVDCFEALRSFVIRVAPALQLRTGEFAYRTRGAEFLVEQFVCVTLGIENDTAEGRRRIRRLTGELSDPKSSESPSHCLLTDENRRLLGKSPGDKWLSLFDTSISNLRGLSEVADQAGGALDLELSRLEVLPDRIAWVRRLLPSLSGPAIYQFLNRIGYPVLVPDRRCQTFLYRLGLLSKVSAKAQDELTTCHLGAGIAASINRSLGEVNLWIQMFTGGDSGCPSSVALCRQKPDCDLCPLQPHCAWFRFQRPIMTGNTKVLSIKDWHPTDRPRERLIQNGAGTLEESELLAIVLRTGSGKANALDLARSLIGRFGSLQGVDEATLDELQEVHGIGKMKAAEIKAAFELGRRLVLKPLKVGDCFTCSDDAYRSYRGHFSHVKQEEFILLMLNNKNRVIREEIVSRGTLDASLVHPREVFKAALKASAASVIFIHNHPSGDPEPSHDDRVVTQKLERAAETLQIRVLDHVIVGADSYYSFADGCIVRPKV